MYNFLYTVLCDIILKHGGLQVFTMISLLPWQPISAQYQRKRKSFDTTDFLNKDFQLAKLKQTYFSQQILQLLVSPF